MIEWKELREKVTSPSDVATVLIAGTAGFAIDLFLMTGGVPPGTTAGLFAAGALGLKQGADALRAELGQTKAERKRLSQLDDKAQNLLKAMTEAGSRDSRQHRRLVRRLAKAIRLREVGAHRDDVAFADVIAKISDEFLLLDDEGGDDL